MHPEQKSNSHSSSTMHSCKLWNYLMLLRGEKKRSAEAEMKEGGANNENGVKKKRQTAHTNIRQHEVSEKDYVGPYPVGPVRFILNIKGLCSLSGPFHQSLILVSVWSKFWTKILRRAPRRTKVVCMCVFLSIYRRGVFKTEVVAGAHGPVAFCTVWNPSVQKEHQSLYWGWKKKTVIEIKEGSPPIL